MRPSTTTELAAPITVVDELSHWQERNDEFLAAALHWLRLRLARLAQKVAPEATPPAKSSDFLNGVRAAVTPKRGPATDAELAQAAQTLAMAAATEPPPALLLLAQRFGLTRFEWETLLLCAALELDTRMASLCAQAQNNPAQPYPTFALAMALFDEPAWEVLSPERPLRYWRLIEINQPGAQPLTSSALRADERIVNYLKGLNYLDDRLRPWLMPFDAPRSASALPPSQQQIVVAITTLWHEARAIGALPVIQLTGMDPVSKQLVAQQAAAQMGLHLERLPTAMLPTDAAEVETFARLWQRDSVLLPVALYLDAHEVSEQQRSEGAGQAGVLPLQRFLARSGGAFFVSTRDARGDLGLNSHTLQVQKPTPGEQCVAWATVLNGLSGTLPVQLAGQFNLNVSTIEQIANQRIPASRSNGHLPQERIWDACLIRTCPQLDLLAQRVEPKATWDDIVLPPDTEAVLRQLAGQVRQRSTVYDSWGFRQKLSRGLGINALFAGDSGTGKTMAAEVLANDLRLNLYRIDLSGVVSKYIGETEKNLRRLFDAAEDGGAILFFDEADSLFGKRSEVKDSHDRYANIEINYLLQRMEAYSGLAILATNMKNALDEAFTRRLRFIANFAFPGQRERKLIWQRVFPAQTPLAALDYERLARLNLSGGAISNIALNAAFTAAQRNEQVSMPLILEAARAEYRKMDRPIKEAEFQWI